MELRHLTYFIAIAEELHFGRAAKRLHMTQPPLSQQIKALEEEIGAQLFMRTRHKVELTAAGKAFLIEARQILQQARRAKQIAKETQEGMRGRLRIGFVTSASYSILPAVVRRFRHQHPLIDLELIEMIPSRQLNAAKSGLIDCGILRPPVKDDAVVLTTLLDEPLVAALPTGHRKAGQKAVSLKTLAEDAFVLFPRHHGPGIYDVILRACHDAGFTPNISYTPNEMQTLLAYVAAGLGISLVPQSLCGFHPNTIRYLPLKTKTTCVQLSIISPQDSNSPVAQNFIALCLEVGAEYTSRNRKAPHR